MTWSRAPVADYLATMLTTATEGAVKVHPSPPETINGPAIVVSRPVQIRYNAASFCWDEVTLPIVIASGIEQEDAIDSIKNVVRQAIDNDQTLGGNVAQANANEERNWRNMTGAGGIQLLLVELIVVIWM